MDKPILFSKPMVLALLAGMKTQTRRLARLKSHVTLGDIQRWEGEGIVQRAVFTRDQIEEPRFAVGDRLWVKENYRGPQAYETNGYKPKDWGNKPIWYVADGDPPAEHTTFWSTRVRPSIHMPKWMSRLTLTVTEVRVQRLQEISEADAYAEGIECWSEPGLCSWRVADIMSFEGAIDAYRMLWDSINADPGARWKDNPWIVAVSFTVAKHNIDRSA